MSRLILEQPPYGSLGAGLARWATNQHTVLSKLLDLSVIQAFDSMATTARALIEGVYLPAAAPATPGQYVAPSSPAKTRTILKKATLCNTDNAGHTVTIYKVPSGQMQGANYAIWSAVNVGAGATVDVPDLVNHVLETGDFLSCFASVAGKVVLTVSGIEMQV